MSSSPDELPADEGFLFSLPMYTIAAEEPDLAEDEVAVATFRIDGAHSLLLFTDADLAERFLAEERLTGRKPLRIADQPSLVEVVQGARERGAGQVILDVSRRRGRLFLLPTFLQVLTEDEPS